MDQELSPVGPVEKLIEETFELLRTIEIELEEKPDVPPPTAAQRMDDFIEKYTKGKNDLLNLHPGERKFIALKNIHRLFQECRARYMIVSKAQRNADFFSIDFNRKKHMPKHFTHEDYLQALEACKLFAEAAVCELRTAFDDRFEAIKEYAILIEKKPLSEAEGFHLRTEAERNLDVMRYISDLANIGVDAFANDNFATLEKINLASFLQ